MNIENHNFEELTEESITKLLDFQPLLSSNDEILAATMLALCGLGRQGDAILLCDKVMEASMLSVHLTKSLVGCPEIKLVLISSQNRGSQESY